MANFQFEDIIPWGESNGDTGLSSRLKLHRNFDKIKTWADSLVLPSLGPFTVWGQNYWLNGQPKNVTGSLSDVENIEMSGNIIFNDNSHIYEDTSRRLNLFGYEGILAKSNLTVNGAVVVNDGNNNAPLVVNSSKATGNVLWTGIDIKHGNTLYGGIRMDVRDGALRRYDHNYTPYTIWDSGNFAPDNYLPLTGGTLTGDLTINGAGISINAQNENDEWEAVFEIDSTGQCWAGAQIMMLESGTYNNVATYEGIAALGYVTDDDLADYVASVAPGTGPQADMLTVTMGDGDTDHITVPFATQAGKLKMISAQKTSPTGNNYIDILEGTFAFSCDNLTTNGTDNAGLQVGYSVDKWQITALSGHLYIRQNDDANGLATAWTAWNTVLDTGNWSTFIDLSGFATTSQLSGKQDEIHFLNTNDSDTEVAFSYLHLPLGSVSAGHASLDVLPSSGGDMTGDIDMQSNYLRFNFDSYICDESGTLELHGDEGIVLYGRPRVHTVGSNFVDVALETDIYEYLEGGTASISSTVVKKQDSGMTYSRDGNTYTLNGGNVDNGEIILRVNFAVTGSPVVKVTITPSSESNYDFGAVGLLNTDTLSSDGGVTSSIIKNDERTILAKASGTTAVTSFFKATEGSNYIEICYAKDSSASSGSDKVTISFDTLGFVPVNGGTMTGDLNLGAHQLKFQNGQIENTTADGGYMHLVSAGGQFHFHGDTNYGTCVAAAFNQQSDLTLKNVKSYLEPSVEEIAAAPIIEFSWKGDTYRRLHLGSAAQYWRDVFPQATLEDANGKLAMDYGAIALAGAITAARKAVALEQRVSELERLLATK